MRIALLPVKNEEWILDQCLSTLSEICDVIFVADQSSTDNTTEVVCKYKKCILIKNENFFHDNSIRWKLLDLARSAYLGTNVIFNIDADEIISANILNEFNVIEELAPGQSMLMQWINLWGSSVTFRDDCSVWSNSYKHFIFKDDKKHSFNKDIVLNDHTGRIPFEYSKNFVIQNSLKILHYQFLDLKRMKSKQRFYRATELVRGLNPHLINQKYIYTRDLNNVGLSKIKDEWIKGWRNLSFLQFECGKDWFWYDDELLRLLHSYGGNFFRYLDIWDDCRFDKFDERNFFIKYYHQQLQKNLKLPIIYKALSKF